MPTFRNMGDHATELVVGDTKPWVGPGEFIDLSADDVKANEAKISSGGLVDISTIPEDEPPADVEPEPQVETRGTAKKEGSK